MCPKYRAARRPVCYGRRGSRPLALKLRTECAHPVCGSQRSPTVASNAWKARMTHARQPARLAGSPMGPHNHVCAFFQNRDDEYKLLLPFIAEGFGGRARVSLVDPSPDGHSRLTRGDSVDGWQGQQLVSADWQTLSRGVSSCHDMRRCATSSADRGLSSADPSGAMEWALEFPGVTIRRTRHAVRCCPDTRPCVRVRQRGLAPGWHSTCFARIRW